ncbi:DsbA family protein [Krasilnikovia sp. M28-CT-15]|uniref:DsbA family protein n=1 Tax=Krasilnikovia sp. M28-CT-15 TaxID=3373540 RepID=UPI0038763CA0
MNTFDAHRLCQLAADHSVADKMMERLFQAYHTEGLNVAEPQTLERLGDEVGLDPADVRKLLGGNDYAKQVRADERRAAECGVTGEPYVPARKNRAATVTASSSFAGTLPKPPTTIRRPPPVVDARCCRPRRC